MAHANLHEFIQQLRREGDLAVVDAEVDPLLEVPEIHRRVIAAGGPALLFTRPRGGDFPLVTNLFGSPGRIERAFGPRPKKFVADLARLAERLLPPTFSRLLEARGVLSQALRVGLSRRRSGPVLEFRQDAPDLTRLPATTSWPEDGGPFFTLGLVYTELPGGGKPNLGLYRMQVHDAVSTGMHWQIGKGGGFHYHAAEERGEALPVTVFLGGPPALILAAVAPLPEGLPELLLASLVLGKRLPTVEAAGLPHPLVAEADFALVGQVAAGERRAEGPFGDHYGYYSLRHEYPVFRCRTLFHRRGAVFPATVVGKPRQEDFWLGDYLQELLSPLFPLVMPAVRDLWSYGETGYHSLTAAVVRERYGREAMASAFRILGEGQLSLTKFLILVDRPLDLRDFRGLLAHVLQRARFESDLHVFSQISMDTLDYTGPRVNEGSKAVLLGLGEPVRELPDGFAGPLPAGAREAVMFCPGCLVVEGPGYADDPGYAARLARDPALGAWPLVVLSDRARLAAASEMNFLWTTFTRLEPAADIHARSDEVVRRHIASSAPVVLDARMKPWYPRELFCDSGTAKRVTRRWSEYFPGGGVEMGSSDLAHLDPV